MLQNILTPVLILSGLGLLFGLGLAFASKKFEVKENEKIAQVRELLPGANCGACGYSGCDSFAAAVVEGNGPLNACPVGGAEAAKKISELLGVEAGEVERKTARVLCAGTYDNCKQKFKYSGIEDCTAAAGLYGGSSACLYGCLGLGNCARACSFDAIVIENGLARVIQSKCTACGKCVAACPKGIIEIVPQSSEYTVRCSSLDKGNIVRQNCQVGCIGCRKCSKVCPVDAISFKGTLAKINPDLCTNCGACMEECPTKAINYYHDCSSNTQSA
jgi:electron transport complex protein RnfB